MLLSHIIDIVRHAVNEYSTADDTFSQETDQSIVRFITNAVPFVFTQVSLPYLEPNIKQCTEQLHFTSRPDGRNMAVIAMPDDFVRVAKISSPELKKSIYHLLPVESPEHNAQMSEAAGVGSGEFNPMAFLALDETGAQGAIEIHSFSNENATVNFTYVADPEITEDKITVDDRLDKALAYYAASLYLQSVSDVNGSHAASTVAKDMIQTLTIN